MNLQSKTFYSLRSVTINVSSLDVVSNERSFSNAFSNEEPTSNLHNDHSVHSNLGHAGLSPLESKSISNQSRCSLHNLSQLPGGGRGQLNLGVLCEGFQSGLRKSQEISGGLSNEVEGHYVDLL